MTKGKTPTTKNKLVLPALILAVAVIYLIFTGRDDTIHYYFNIDEILARGETARYQNLTIAGFVLGNTITYDPNTPYVSFDIVQLPEDEAEWQQQGGLYTLLDAATYDPMVPRMTIIYQDLMPDQLAHGAHVVVRGQIHNDGRFYAEELIFQCPSRYEDLTPAP